MSKLKLVVLGSTRGSNLQAIIDEINSNNLQAEISLVISNKKDAYILERAENHNIKNLFISAKGLTREEYDAKAMYEINKINPDLVLLIGYMRIVSESFVNKYRGKILNVHPSLLPKHPGLMDLAVHQAVLDANDDESGCTIHQGSEEGEGGESVLQLKCKIAENDTAETLKAKVQKLETQAWIDVIKNWSNKQ